MAKNSEISIKDAWQELVDTYPIVEEIEKNGVYHIDASIIRGVKEPRLMLSGIALNMFLSHYENTT